MENTYELGYALGKHWADRDATPAQRERVIALGEGKAWVAQHADAARIFTTVVDSSKDNFLGVDDDVTNAFVAGFIDGVRSRGSGD